jgi:AraC-like DNA-binding protein
MLALDLLADPALRISRWASERQLHPGSVARGFRQLFGITAAAFRSNARAHRALGDVLASRGRLAELAVSHGFADQAHMTRAIGAVAGSAPARLRRGQKSFGQDRAFATFADRSVDPFVEVRGR